MSFPASPSGPPPSGGAPRGYVLGPDGGEAYHRLGSLNLRKVRAVDTRGGLDLVDHRVPPATPPRSRAAPHPLGPTSSRRTR